MNRWNFTLYDWGDEEVNEEKYGDVSPPIIEMTENQNIPLRIFSGKQDTLINPIDAEWTYHQNKEGMEPDQNVTEQI